jgi:hypothetical protein
VEQPHRISPRFFASVRPTRLEATLREHFICRGPAALVEIPRTQAFRCGRIHWISNQTVDVCSVEERRLLVGHQRTSIRVENDGSPITRIVVSAIPTDWP